MKVRRRIIESKVPRKTVNPRLTTTHPNTDPQESGTSKQSQNRYALFVDYDSGLEN